MQGKREENMKKKALSKQKLEKSLAKVARNFAEIIN